MVKYDKSYLQKVLTRHGFTVRVMDGGWAGIGIQLAILEKLDQIIGKKKKDD